MYVLVKKIEGNYGGEYEDTYEYTDYEDFLEASTDALAQGKFYSAYKIAAEYTASDIRGIVAEREEARQCAVAVAKAKLTADECRLLGIV